MRDWCQWQHVGLPNLRGQFEPGISLQKRQNNISFKSRILILLRGIIIVTTVEKNRLIEIDNLIAQLMAERETINPYANLKSISNKEFGEAWSEPEIIRHCPSFCRVDEKGWDLWSESLGRVEVKSSRLPCKQITFNQCHPKDCDYFLFVLYDTVEGEAYKYLVPAKRFFDFSITVQHERKTKEEASCFSMSGSSKTNKEKLAEFFISSWEDLEKLAKGE